MTHDPAHDWRLILLAVVAGAGALLCMALSAAMTGYALLEPWLNPAATNQVDPQNATATFVISGGMFLVAGVLIATVLTARGVLRGQADLSFESRPMRWWVVLGWIVVWLGASGAAQVLHDAGASAWMTAVLDLLAIAAPIYVIARLAIGGIRGGTRLRLWGSMATGMLLGTGLAAGIEVVLLLGAIAIGIMYLIVSPQQVIALQRLVTQLSTVAGPEEALAELGPILTSPVSLVVALLAVAVATPLVEEIAKSVPVWLQHGQLSKGAHGFWVGALSGAGFALVEGILVSSSTSESLAYILTLRAGSSIMHVVASSLAGWGIGAFRSTGKLSRAVAGYLAAMGVHSIWNAAVVTIGYGGIRTAYGEPQPDLAGLVFTMGGGMLLIALIGLLPAALIGLNLRFRSESAAVALADVGEDIGPAESEAVKAQGLP